MSTLSNDRPCSPRRGLVAVSFILVAVIATGCTFGARQGTGQPSVPAADSVAVENVRALAHLYGHVRYFHPSDEAAAVDWERFLVHGVRTVRNAETPDELRRRLESLFLPIAPTLQIYSGRQAPAPHSLLAPADTSGLEVVAWQHRGVGLGNPGPYSSVRLHRSVVVPSTRRFVALTQAVAATPYRGQQLRLEAAVRAAVSGSGNAAQLWLRVDRPQGEIGFFDNMSDRPIVAAAWHTHTIVGTVAPDAEWIAFGGLLAGAGEAWFDAFRLQVRHDDTETWQDVPLANPDFEEGSDGQLPGWGGTGGVAVVGSDENPFAGRRAALVRQQATVAPAQPLFAQRPAPEEVAERSLGRGLAARVPLAVYSGGGATRPAADPAAAAALEAGLAGVEPGLTAVDPALRAAAVIVTWNVFQHFYPYFDVVPVDWDATLSGALRRAERDRDEREFLRTLQWMVAQLDDGHGNVHHRAEQGRAGLPLRLERIEEEIVVALAMSHVQDCARVGDVLLAIDGEPVTDALREAEAHISGSPQYRAYRAVQELGRGERGTEAVLLLSRGGAATQCQMTRDQQTAPAEPRPDPITELVDGVMYVDLRRAEMQAIREAMSRLAGARGVIFDMRGYPRSNHDVLRHLSPDTLRSAHWQVPQRIRPVPAPLVGYDTSGRWTLPPAEPRLTGRVVFLTDARAISYAESMLGIVEHYRLGDILGAPTAGANGNANPFTVPGGYSIVWTGMRVVKHDGSQHHLVGIRPTVPVDRTLRALREGRDEYIERALELIMAGRPPQN